MKKNLMRNSDIQKQLKNSSLVDGASQSENPIPFFRLLLSGVEKRETYSLLTKKH